MPKKIVKYKLTSSGTTPDFVSVGGHFLDNERSMVANIIGVSVDDDSQISEEAEILNKAQLISYVNSISILKIPSFEEMTSEEKEAHVNEWLEYVGMSSLE